MREPCQKMMIDFELPVLDSLPSIRKLSTNQKPSQTPAVWVHNPTLFYIGMRDQWFTINMVNAQA